MNKHKKEYVAVYMRNTSKEDEMLLKEARKKRYGNEGIFISKKEVSELLEMIKYNKNYFNKDGSYGYTEEKSYENLNKLEEALGGQDE